MAERSYLLEDDFWAAAIERAIKTGAQAILASGSLDVINLIDIHWQGLFAIAIVAALASILTSIASGVKTGGPSLGPETLRLPEGAANGNAGNGEQSGTPEDLPGKHGRPEHEAEG